ncbi:hypothetical protein ACHQM5_013763 [Ranunculus cassubicifolius]
MSINSISVGEFSFPTIIKRHHSLDFTTTLWHAPSEVSDNTDGGESVKSVADEEEKMDMLWESFNDEFQRNSSIGRNRELKSSLEIQEMRRSSSRAICTRKQSLLLVMKVLRKLFLLHNSHAVNRRHS